MALGFILTLGGADGLAVGLILILGEADALLESSNDGIEVGSSDGSVLTLGGFDPCNDGVELGSRDGTELGSGDGTALG